MPLKEFQKLLLEKVLEQLVSLEHWSTSCSGWPRDVEVAG
jgi:hypothetical protein